MHVLKQESGSRKQIIWQRKEGLLWKNRVFVGLDLCRLKNRKMKKRYIISKYLILILNFSTQMIYVIHRHSWECLFLCKFGGMRMEYRNKQINFRVTSSEYEVIQKRMKEAGITHPSAFLRKMAMDGYIVRMDMTDIKEVLRLVGINSKNLNQYAKRANETGSIYADDIDDLLIGQKEIIGLLRQVLDRLSAIK